MLFAELARVGSRRSPKDNLTAAELEEEEATTRRPHVCGAALHPGGLTAPQHPPALERETATATPLSRSVRGCAPAKPNSILNNLASSPHPGSPRERIFAAVCSPAPRA